LREIRYAFKSSSTLLLWMKPELRKRLIDSIEYLRKMGFFEDYSNLTSNEIYRRISRKIKRKEEYLNKSIAEIDYDMACLDAKRVFKVPETLKKGKVVLYRRVEERVKEGELESLLDGLVRISRGVFQPKIMDKFFISEWGIFQPKAVDKCFLGKWVEVDLDLNFKGRRVGIELACKKEGENYVPDLETILESVRRINAWTKDTGYQYYGIRPEGKAYVVLSKDEAEKLKNERGWRLFHPHFELDPEIRERLINSMDFLRRMGFFEDYSNLSSWEILEKIFSGEINYSSLWYIEWDSRPYGASLRKNATEHKEEYMEKSDAEIDYKLVPFDIKRFFIESREIEAKKGMGIALIKKLARISRGVFNPTNIREEWNWKYNERGDVRCRVFFKFRGKEHYVDFTSYGEALVMEPAVWKINELIKDTGYQYYSASYSEWINYVVLTKEEAEKLKERGWRLSLPPERLNLD
jgi:hypothetical protein